MTFNELCGVRTCNYDAVTGKDIGHREKYRRAINALGGLDSIIPFIPYPKGKIAEALRNGDEYLNTLPLLGWDMAAGFVGVGNNFRFVGGSLWGLYESHGVTCASCSEGVCLLKEAARMWAEG